MHLKLFEPTLVARTILSFRMLLVLKTGSQRAQRALPQRAMPPLSLVQQVHQMPTLSSLQMLVLCLLQTQMRPQWPARCSPLALLAQHQIIHPHQMDL